MILRKVTFLLASALGSYVMAEVAPDITVLEEGYNLIAKIPCLQCPFLFQDTSKGLNEEWTQREDNNSLLLNVSLPYDSAHISINNAALYSGRRNLPRIYANQVVQDFSVDDLSKTIASNQLEASHETNLGGGFFGLSYRLSLRTLKTEQDLEALLFRFDVFELYSDLMNPLLKHKLDSPTQKILEVRLIQKPLLSALQPSPTYEILSASLISRSSNPNSDPAQKTMSFLDWDDYGQKGTAAHAMTYGAESMVSYIASGFWGLFTFILGVVALFVVVCLICIFGWGFWEDDYEKAQHGKRRKSRGSGTGSGSWKAKDVEQGQGKARFLSAEELGLGGRGRVVGVGKSD